MHTGRSDAPARMCERVPDDIGRDAVAARRADACSEHRGLDGTLRVDGRAAGVTVFDLPAQARDPARDGAASVRVVSADPGGLADAARLCGERPVAGIAEERDRGPRFRAHEPKRVRLETGHAQHRDVVPRVERDRLGVERKATGSFDSGRVLPGDDVRGGHDEAASGDPAGARDSEPAGVSKHPYDAWRRLADTGPVQDCGVRRRADGERAFDREQRVDPRERMEDGRRRQQVVELANDHRALGVAAEVRLARDEQHHGAEHPDDREARRRSDQEAAGRVDCAQRLESHRGAHPRADVAADRLEHDRAEDRAAEGEERRVARGAPAGQEVRREPRAQQRPSHDSGERERGGEQAAEVAGDREQRDERDRDPVEQVHEARLLPGAVDTLAALGGVVQLVRTPACHAGGRGFESRRSRSR